MTRDDLECSSVQWQVPSKKEGLSLQKPSWTPILLSGVIPSDASDILAILVMGIIAVETIALGTALSVFNSRVWLSLLVIPPTCALASVSTTTRRTKEELALFAYGGSARQVLLRYFFRGAISTLIAFSPVTLQGFLTTGSILETSALVLILVIAGGLFYSLPSLRRIRSPSFVENYKS